MKILHNTNLRWLIIGGCPRSGTTMLNFLLNSNQRIFLANEQNIYKTIQLVDKLFYREDHLKKRKERTFSQREGLLNQQNLKFMREKATIRRKVSKKRVLETLFYESLIDLEKTEISGLIYLGDKFPQYYKWDLTNISNLLGKVKYIHITRSPLDTINSNMFRTQMAKKGEDWYSVGSLTKMINQWIEAYNFASSATDQKLDLLNLKYEDLISDSDNIVCLIANFLDIDCEFDISQIIKFQSGRESLSSKDHEFIAQHIPKDILDWNQKLDFYFQKYKSLKLVKQPTANPHLNRLHKIIDYFKF